jgi:hypothetical protein
LSDRRLVLVEHITLPGASDADARARAALLHDAGFDVRAFVCDPHHVGAPVPSAERGGRAAVFGADRAGLDALRAAVAEAEPATVVVAAPAAVDRALAGVAPAAAQVRWWPSAFAPSAAVPDGVPALEDGMRAIDWACGEPARGARARLPLWDGPYVLAPVPLAGRGGAQLIEAFAAVAEEEDSLDLVVLGEAQSSFESLARRLGVGLRVHFAGPAPREAEYAWWSAAAAAVFAGEGPFAAGMAWRALESGCPLLVAGDAPEPAALRAWLESQRCLAGARAGGANELTAALFDAAARAERVRDRVERGRALAKAQHHALPARLAAALGGRAGRRAA